VTSTRYTDIAILNSVSTKNLVLNRNWWTLWVIYLFLPKTYIRIFYQEGIHHCAAHKYSTATVIKKCFQSQQQI